MPEVMCCMVRSLFDVPVVPEMPEVMHRVLPCILEDSVC